ncbi:chemosensory pili system protein ChpA (sensor histidine kinase/response regulator) [Nitrosomonas cryotolerans]|uniref:Chemotaxis protein CheA n=1 Tax=Nitrosomonas cryotolerans ATCC 49181 TaxID=1131553 RepID=A0A1N6FKM0_9PROT|nr:Hpt domain-containing protein [Nitrosomonas cryotolerans]SFP82231.1 chemosensory pili system protein ChpA (sensor histidine kinase/response regulator) [Nitrosomonas cryotolerans]SIN95812.1 chemosensory pili system protein ChpA (sensor histidine kinase/response regulator) [Nitrosomonas cryotolerans ATCC 49181]
MNAKAKLNIASIIGIQDGINQIFSLIEQYLDAYIQNLDDDTQIDSFRQSIHQLNGLLEMLELDGLTIISQRIGKLTDTLIQEKIKPESATLNTLKQTVSALLHYLHELIHGAEDNPLRLYPVYCDLMRAQGLEKVSESDLFFPKLVTDPPLQAASPSLEPAAMKASAKQARTEYQTGLLKWLRDTTNAEGLRQMSSAVARIEKMPGSIEQRSFWWATVGFLDSLPSQKSDIDLSIRRLCGKIEQEIRRMVEGTPGSTVQLMREILYQIAHSRSASKRIQEINHAYEWPSPSASLEAQTNEQLANKTTLQSTLDAMRETLTKVNHDWREFSTGNPEKLAPLVTQIEELKQLAILTQYLPLEKLITVMGGAITYLRIRPQNMGEDLAMEMATSLLLVENILDDFNKPSPGLLDQIEVLSARLRGITTGKQNDSSSPDAARPDEIEYKTQEKRLQAQASQEILANLEQIEGILDRFFIDTTIRTDLPALSPLFKQVSGVLIMLDLEPANKLLNLCHHLVNQFLDPQYTIPSSEQTLLADGLSSLGFFIEAYKNAQPDHHHIIETALALFEDTTTNQATLVTSGNTTPSNDLKKEGTTPAIDSELLDIFLEEASEILADIANNLQNCRNDPADAASLATLRRGFHTLKGSGRMVKLPSLSEVAWSMEQILNRRLSERKPATPGLLDLIDRVHREYIQWCSDLKVLGTAEINADEILSLAKNLINGKEPETIIPVEAPSTEIEKKADTDAVAEIRLASHITIGDTIIPVDLFEIFTIESNQHLAVLELELNNLITHHDAMVNHQFMLASHTLASISRTLGLIFIADLGFALEQWLSQRLKDTVRPTESDLHRLHDAIELLSQLLKKVHHQQLPEALTLQTAKTLSQTLTQCLSQEKTLAGMETQPDAASSTRALPSPASSALQPATHDPIDSELLLLFIEEAQELIPVIGRNLRAWRTHPQNKDIHKALLRALHALKGSARMAGAIPLGELLHTMESDIETACHKQTMGISTSTIDQLESGLDRISEHIEQLQHAFSAEKQSKMVELPVPESQNETIIPSYVRAGTIPVPLAASDECFPAAQKTMLRVDAALIDQLVNESGETSIVRSGIEAQLYNFKQSLSDLTESADRLRGQLREIEIQAETQMQSHLASTQEGEPSFDPLEFDRFTRFQELTRLMAESVDDIVTVKQSLHITHSTTEEAVAQQARMNRKLQQELMRIRTIPFGRFSEHYYRLVRQSAKDIGKKASLEIQGDEIEIDRSVLERMNSSLEHLLRNAIVHGIEAPDRRRQLGKPETGQITINLQQEGNEVIIILSDDGSGLDIARIHKKALQLDLIPQNAALDDEQIRALIFMHGLSTSEAVTGIAGRGIGMDIVKNEIATLGGHITVNSEIDQGTTFSIHLPLTLAVAQTLLVRAETQIYAIPTVIVEQVKEFDSDALQAAYQTQIVDFNEKNYPFFHLSHLFGKQEHVPEIKRYNRIILLHSGTLRLALHVDELIGNSEIVVKNIGPQLARAPGVEGATIMGDGEIILIINPIKLMQRDEVQKTRTTPAPQPEPSAMSEKSMGAATIMVVDDSLTVRKVTGRLLEREGCEVLIAKDGLGAIQLLRDVIPDVMLVDLEMPNMNGFELIRHIRNNPDTVNIPIIIISSRTADKHREMASALGVNLFLGKPYKEEALLAHITRYIQP